MNRKICVTLVLVFGICYQFLGPEAAGAQNALASGKRCETGCLLPPTGLVGWWPGDGNANDIQLGSNGNLMSGASFAAGLIGEAFSLDGVNAFVDIPDTPALHVVTTAVTVDAWINPQLSPGFFGWIFARRDPFVSEGVGLAINNEGFLFATLQTNFFSCISSATPVIQFNGEWQHVALTVDTSINQVFLYVNGRAISREVACDGSAIIATGAFANVSHLFIGKRQNSETSEGISGGGHFKGLIDEVELYNRALGPTEIQAITAVGPKGKCKPTAP